MNDVRNKYVCHPKSTNSHEISCSTLTIKCASAENVGKITWIDSTNVQCTGSYAKFIKNQEDEEDHNMADCTKFFSLRESMCTRMRMRVLYMIVVAFLQQQDVCACMGFM